MLTHYKITLRGTDTTLVGAGQLAPLGVLVPKLNDDKPLRVAINRDLKRPNERARKLCFRLIRKTFRAAQLLYNANLLDESTSVQRVRNSCITHPGLFHIVGVREIPEHVHVVHGPTPQHVSQTQLVNNAYNEPVT